MTDILELAESVATINALADAAAQAFYGNAVRFGTGKYPRGDIRKSRNWAGFKKIARLCMAEEVDVGKFIDIAFRKVMARHSIVSVTDICEYDPKETVADDNVMSIESKPKDLWNMLACKLLEIAFAIDGTRSRIEFLDSPMYGFPAWFRVFFPEAPVNDLIVHWGDVAFEELLENPSLDKYLKDLRPRTYSLLKEVFDKLSETK